MNDKARALPLRSLPVDGFRETSVLVIGDLMLDRYVMGDVTRISPEAPVPVVAVRGEKTSAGGAANVALNVAGLRAKTIIAGVVGSDDSGRKLSELLANRGVDLHAIVTDPGRPTTSKTRIMCGSHQIARLDIEICSELAPGISSELMHRVTSVLRGKVGAVILSDYAKGVLGTSFTRSVIAECATQGIPVFVDPKRADYSCYAGATCVTPNLKEFHAAASAKHILEQDLPTAGSQLREHLGLPMLLITQGSDGMTLVTSERAYYFPALAEAVFDVSGAGDTVIATFACAVAAGCDVLSAVCLANFAASIVVRKVGTYPISWDDLRSFIGEHLGEPTGERLHETGASWLRQPPLTSTHS